MTPRLSKIQGQEETWTLCIPGGKELGSPSKIRQNYYVTHLKGAPSAYTPSFWEPPSMGKCSSLQHLICMWSPGVEPCTANPWAPPGVSWVPSTQGRSTPWAPRCSAQKKLEARTQDSKTQHSTTHNSQEVQEGKRLWRVGAIVQQVGLWPCTRQTQVRSPAFQVVPKPGRSSLECRSRNNFWILLGVSQEKNNRCQCWHMLQYEWTLKTVVHYKIANRQWKRRVVFTLFTLSRGRVSTWGR